MKCSTAMLYPCVTLEIFFNCIHNTVWSVYYYTQLSSVNDESLAKIKFDESAKMKEESYANFINQSLPV